MPENYHQENIGFIYYSMDGIETRCGSGQKAKIRWFVDK